MFNQLEVVKSCMCSGSGFEVNILDIFGYFVPYIGVCCGENEGVCVCELIWTKPKPSVLTLVTLDLKTPFPCRTVLFKGILAQKSEHAEMM